MYTSMIYTIYIRCICISMIYIYKIRYLVLFKNYIQLLPWVSASRYSTKSFSKIRSFRDFSDDFQSVSNILRQK